MRSRFLLALLGTVALVSSAAARPLSPQHAIGNPNGQAYDEGLTDGTSFLPFFHCSSGTSPFCKVAPGTIAGVGADAMTISPRGVARTLPDRATDTLNVKDFGAALDGSTDDSAAFNAARAAAPTNGVIDVPAGGMNVPTTPTGGKSTPILYRMQGNAYGTSTTPVTGLRYDWVENFLGNAGGKFLGRAATLADGPATQRIDLNVTHTGGTAGYVTPNLQVRTVIPAASADLNNYVWNGLFTLDSSATGAGQHVAAYFQGNRRGGNSPIWGAVSEVIDWTGGASPQGTVGHEIDNRGDGFDINGVRVIVDGVVTPVQNQTSVAEFGHGFRVQGGSAAQAPYTVVKKVFEAAVQADTAFDSTNATARTAVAPVPVIGASSTAQAVSINGKALTLASMPSPALQVGSWVWVSGAGSNGSASYLAAKVTAVSGLNVTLDTASARNFTAAATTIYYTIGAPPLTVLRANAGQVIDLVGDGSYIVRQIGSSFQYCRAYAGICAAVLFQVTDGNASFAQPVAAQSDLTIAGVTYQQRLPTKVIGAAYTLAANDNFIAVSAAGGAVPITLPACTANTIGAEYVIKKTDNSANPVTLGNATDSIDGSSGAQAVSLTTVNSKFRARCTTASVWYLL